MSVKLSPIPRKQFTDVNGNPVAGGKLFYYVSGTSTKAVTYSDSAGTVANTNPIILDSSGRCPVAVYLVDGVTYEEVLAPSTDTDPPVSPIYAEPDIIGTGASTAIADEWIASNYVPTFISANSFSVPGDVTSVLEVGRRLKTTDSGGVNYSRILTSSFAAGVTTVTVLVDGGLLLDSGLSTISYSLLSVANYSTPEPALLRDENLIINGAMEVAQAGTTFAAAVSLAYDLDGWTNENTSAAVFTITQVNATLPNTNKMRRMTITTADAAIAAGDYVAQRTAIEGYGLRGFVGKTFTIGFYVQSSVTGIHCISIYDGTKSYVDEFNITVADTPQYKTITVFGGLQTAASFANAAGIYLFFTNACGATYQTTKGTWNVGFFVGTSSQVNDCATIGNVYGLTDVTMNLGTRVMPYARRYGEELRICQRYYWRGLPTLAHRSSSYAIGSTASMAVSFPVTMRTTPTVAATTPGKILVNAGTEVLDNPTPDGCRYQVTSTAISASFGVSFVSTDYFEASARL